MIILGSLSCEKSNSRLNPARTRIIQKWVMTLKSWRSKKEREINRTDWLVAQRNLSVIVHFQMIQYEYVGRAR